MGRIWKVFQRFVRAVKKRLRAFCMWVGLCERTPPPVPAPPTEVSPARGLAGEGIYDQAGVPIRVLPARFLQGGGVYNQTDFPKS